MLRHNQPPCTTNVSTPTQAAQGITSRHPAPEAPNFINNVTFPSIAMLYPLIGKGFLFVPATHSFRHQLLST